MTEAKIHPPSRSRVADARAAGLAPRPLLVGLSAALFALASCVHSFGRSVAQDLATLLSAPLDALAHGESRAALDPIAPVIGRLLRTTAGAMLGVAVCVVLGLLLAQGSAFAFPRANTRRLAAPRVSLEATLLAIVGLLVLCSFALFSALWLEPMQWPDFGARFLRQLAALFLGLAIVDAAFARTAFFRALFLTRRELREEQREAYGAPELRAARATARQQIADEEP
jgi:type III secretory pathway component EscU